MKKLFFLTLLFGLFLTSDAHASSMNLLFDVSNTIVGLVERFTVTLYDAVAIAYKKVYFLLCMIILPVVIYSYVKNKISEDTVIAFLLAIFLSSAIALNKDNFLTFVYEPFFDTVYNFASYIANASGNGTYSNSGVQGMFANIYESSEALVKILDEIWEKTDVGFSNIFKMFALLITILIIKFLFLFLVALFVIRFTVAVFSAHIIMIIMPITLSLFPFKSLRPYSFNHLKSLFQYGLTIIFYCIAISLSVYLIEEVRKTAGSLDPLGEKGFTFEFLLSAIITAGMGYVMLLSSNEFASKILNVAGNANVLTNRAMNRMASVVAGAGAIGGTGAVVGQATGGLLTGREHKTSISENNNSSKQSSIAEFQKHVSQQPSANLQSSLNNNKQK